MTSLDRITQSPDLMGGKACIRGMRVTVGMLVGQIGAGRSIDARCAMPRGVRKNARCRWR